MTQKQVEASKLVVQNGVSVSSAMREVGYSESAVRKQTLTKSKAYKEIVLPKLKKAGVTLDKYIDNVGRAMNANKQINIEGDVVTTEEPDLNMRLQGNKQAEKLLKLDNMLGINNTEGETLQVEDLQALAGVSDEVELTRILFKKGTQ